MSDVTDEVSGHVAYAFGDWTVALGAVDDDDDGEEAVVATVGGCSMIVGASLADIDGDTAASIYGTLPVGAATNITAFVTTTDATGVDDTYGLGFEHSLGGATLAGGVVNDVSGRTLADLGVRFSF